MDEVAGRLEATGVHVRLEQVRRSDPRSKLTTADLRQFPILKWVTRERMLLTARLRDSGAPESAEAAQQLEPNELVASIYRDAIAEGQPPTKTVAEVLGLSVAAASSRVQRARKAGRLPPTSPGRVSTNNGGEGP
jgi:hypothetical protein